jgi:GTP cyclohydrolase II
MRILTNHPRKLIALEAYGLKITAQVPFTHAKISR